MIKPPEYAALINPIACNAFAMRFVARKDLVEPVTVATGERSSDSSFDAVLLDMTVKASPAEAILLVAPFVTVTNPISVDYAAKLLLARLTVEIGDEAVVQGEILERFLVAPAFKAANPSDPDNRGMVFVGREEDALLGCSRLHFLDNGSRVRVKLEGIPAGGGDLRLLAGGVGALYTTKAKQGSLFEMGTLDDVGNAFPVHRQWPHSGGPGPLTQDKLEATHADALRTALEAKEAEIARLRDEASGRLRADAEAKDAELRRLREEEELRCKAENKEREIRRLQEDAALRAKAAAKARPAFGPMTPEGAAAPAAKAVDFDQAVSRARVRLIRFAILATGAFVLVAAAVLLVGSRLGILK